MTDKRVEAVLALLVDRLDLYLYPSDVTAALAAADAADDCVRVPSEEFFRFVDCLRDTHEYDLATWAGCLYAGEKYEPEED
jgi:hypothetical protein